MTSADDRKPAAPAVEPDSEWTPSGPTLDSSGRLEGAHVSASRPSVRDPLAEPEVWPTLTSLAEDAMDLRVSTAPRFAEATELELDHRPSAPREVVEAVRPPRSTRPLRALLFLLAVAALIGGASLLARLIERQGPALPDPLGDRVVWIDSEPSGATVWRGKKKLGQTPLVLGNAEPEGAPFALRLERRGYRTAEVTVAGGQDQRITVPLVRR